MIHLLFNRIVPYYVDQKIFIGIHAIYALGSYLGINWKNLWSTAVDLFLTFLSTPKISSEAHIVLVDGY